MNVQMVAFVFGCLLLLVAILGGGFEVKELKVPKVGRASRLTSCLFGGLFVFLGIGPPLEAIWPGLSPATEEVVNPPAPPVAAEAPRPEPVATPAATPSTVAAPPRQPGTSNSAKSVRRPGLPNLHKKEPRASLKQKTLNRLHNVKDAIW